MGLVSLHEDKYDELAVFTACAIVGMRKHRLQLEAIKDALSNLPEAFSAGFRLKDWILAVTPHGSFVLDRDHSTDPRITYQHRPEDDEAINRAKQVILLPGTHYSRYAKQAEAHRHG